MARQFLKGVPVRRSDRPNAWKYAFPPGGAYQSLEEVCVRLDNVRCEPSPWIGLFECERGRHVEILTWPAANAVVVAAANALYVVDPASPDQVTGFTAPVEITGVTFDETAQHMFVAESLRIYSFSADRLFRWISEPLGGYGAHLCGCRQGELAVEIRQWQADLENESAPSLIRVRTEDGTIVRPYFSLAGFHRHRRAAGNLL
jgi:hypothetical protein